MTRSHATTFVRRVFVSLFTSYRVLGLGLLGIVVAVPSAESQQAVETRRAVTATASVRVSGSFAELHIHGWAKDSVAITGTVPNDAHFAGGFLTPTAGVSPGAKFFLESPTGVPAGVLELRVPVGARVWAKAGSATIDAEGVTGGLDLNVIGGSVHVTGSPHELTVEAMDGAVTVEGAPPWVRLKTASGDVTLGAGSEDAAVTTVSGNIRVAGKYERLRLSSVTGPVAFTGDIVHGGALDIDTHSGTVDLRFTPKLSADVDIATMSGQIENAFNKRAPIAGREGRGQELAFMAGTGGTRIYVRSFKGNVKLSVGYLKIATF
jgi:hypothetical protein